MRIYCLLLLSVALLTACGTQSTKEKVQTAGNPLPRSGKSIAAKDSAGQQAQPTAPQERARQVSQDSSLGSVTPHRMQFRRISDEDLRLEIAIGNITVDTVLSRFLVSAEWRKPTFLYYRTPAYPGGWIETQLELLGEWLWNEEVTLDTVRLEPTGPSAVLVKFRSTSSLRHWSMLSEAVNLVDVAAEPVLVLKAGTLNHESGYTEGDEDTINGDIETDSFETVQSQSVKVRNQQIIVGRPVEEGQYALHPAPAGTYRYRNSKVFRVGK
jgi:hypothetical protein